MSLERIIIPESVTEIGYYAFKHCVSLKEIIIPDSVTRIENGTFEDCTSLQKVVIPDGVKTIGNCAFWGCRSLEEIAIPNSVKVIGEWAFTNCTSLKEIVIPNSVKTIGHCAFRGCKSLEEIVIPDSVTKIGIAPFQYCDSLKKIHYKNTVYNVTNIDGYCMVLSHSKKYDKYTIHKGYEFPYEDETYYVAEYDGKYAHGKTAKDAIRDLEFKLCKNRGVEQYDGLTLNDKVHGYTFYRIMTGACDIGVRDYCDRTSTDIDGKYTIQEVIDKTVGEYGHDTLLSNLKQLGIV